MHICLCGRDDINAKILLPFVYILDHLYWLKHVSVLVRAQMKEEEMMLQCVQEMWTSHLTL